MKKYSKILIILIFILNVFNIYSKGTNYPERIVSLGPVITESIYILNADNRLIANTIYCTKPEKAKTIEKIGSIVEINIEKIISLKPDLVIAGSLTHPKKLEKIKKTGIKVVQFGYASSFEEICNQFLEIGRLVGEKEKAEKIVNETKSEVDRICKIINNYTKKKVFIQVGNDPLFTAGKNTFINDFIEFAGGINIAADSKNGIYSREKVLLDNPDIIIITTMGFEGEKEKKIWKKYKSINAVKNEQVYIVDSYKICSPTPVIFKDTLIIIANFIHPGLNLSIVK